MPSFNDFINWAIERCNNKNVGYSEDFRYAQTVSYSYAKEWDEWRYSTAERAYKRNYRYDWEKYLGTDGGDITYYDCSSYVSYALKAAGFNLEVFITSGERSVLKSLGWKKLEGDNITVIQGDIGWKDGHTEICYQGGIPGQTAIFMGAHQRDGGAGVTTQPGDILWNQVSIGTIDNPDSGIYTKFTEFYRYYDWDDEYTPVEPENTPIADNLIYALIGNCWWEAAGINPAQFENNIKSSWNQIWVSSSESKYGKSYGGYGLFGWTNVQDETSGEISWNLLNLYSWLTEKGYATTDGYGQTDYLYSVDHHWNYSSDMYDADKIMFHTWETWWNEGKGGTDDLYQLTYDFFRCWEGIHDGTENDRYQLALKAKEYVTEHINDESITEWLYDTDNCVSESVTLNNAVMFFRTLQTLNNSYTAGTGGNSENSPSGTYGGGDSGSESVNMSWEDFLLSSLGRGNGENAIPIHIIKRRRF